MPEHNLFSAVNLIMKLFRTITETISLSVLHDNCCVAWSGGY
jgi:hypothetical protein